LLFEQVVRAPAGTSIDYVVAMQRETPFVEATR
jgi:hypothetical protein